MSEAKQMLTPVGRFVQGDLHNPQTTDYYGKPLTNRNGEARSEYFVAIAIRKDDPEWAAFWAELHAVGVAGFPGGEHSRPEFAWKVKDGDQTPEREGFAGCWIVRMSTGFAIPIYKYNGTTGKHEQIVDPSGIKRGDYIKVYVSVRANGDRTKPGIFINPTQPGVLLVGYGDPIHGGASPDEAFGAAAPALPPGASPTPTGGGPGMATPPAPGAAGAPPAPGAAGSPPAPGAMGAPPAPGAMGAPPAPGAAGAPPAPGAMGAPPAPGYDYLNGPGAPQYQMTPAAGGKTREELNAAGWTNELLVQHGYMVKAG